MGHVNAVDSIIDYESGEQDIADTVRMFQGLINSGQAWKLQGSCGRDAMEFIRCGLCALGPERSQDYWGNFIPSRYDVKEGTKGSATFVTDKGNKILD